MTTYYVSYFEYACDDGVGEQVRYAFNDIGDALDCWAQLSDDGTLDDVHIWPEPYQDKEMPF